MKLTDYIRQDAFPTPRLEVLLNVMVTHSWVMNELAAVMAPHGMTPAQYNVLRILRGSHPERLTCSDIGARLLDRTPDVTRLLNRLKRHDYVARRRAEHDRRVVEVGITDAGLGLLDAMEADVNAAIGRLTRHLADDDCVHLSTLLERLRLDQAA